MNITWNNWCRFFAAIVVLTIFLMPALYATESAGLPWETAMETLCKSLTGKFMKSAAVIAIAVAFICIAVNHGDMTQMSSKVSLGIAFAVAGAVGAGTVLEKLFTDVGACVVGGSGGLVTVLQLFW